MDFRPGARANGASRFLADEAYATYPHCNGYYDHGRRLVVGRAGDGTPRLFGIAVDDPTDDAPELLLDLGALIGGAGTDVAAQDPPMGATAWFDVALDAQVLAAAWAERVVVRDLADAASVPAVVYVSPADWSLDGLVSISADGARLIVNETRGVVRRIVEVRLVDGAAHELLRLDWWANHSHLCPADEDWIGFAHEGSATTVHDRVWGWHPEHAPDGRALVAQHEIVDAAAAGSPAASVALGHERWMFHEPGAIVVAYGDSPVGPRGVHLVPVDGRPVRLLSAGDRDWHCGISRDGTHVVVDTTGPEGAPGRGWQDAGERSSIVLIDVADGTRTVLDETSFEPHPFHPHPSFTPDGRGIVYNRVERDADGAVTRRGVAIVAVPTETAGDHR
ncbi:hypothetical protein [Agromyces sp. NPDC056965]|uniref:hypothetical protein n=1 Tax=Agromyces sp. NPDC056965 TaxID=3345983 RepID=UPI00363345A0